MSKWINIEGARVHNLKDVSLKLPKNKLIVFSGLSGSGKSSLAFDTIFAEGQRRYMESLSAYARQFLDQLDKPDVDRIDGLSPAISIDQKSASHNPRSTVGTVTEIYDYFRILYASIGIPYCVSCGEKIDTMSIQEIFDTILTWPESLQLTLYAPLVKQKKGSHADLLAHLIKEGFSRVRIDGTITRLSDPITLPKTQFHNIDLVVDRLALTPDNHSRLFQSLETATQRSNGLVQVEATDTQYNTLFSENLSCRHCNQSLPEISPRLFSFNSPVGACPECKGLGENLDFDPTRIIAFPQNPLSTATGKILSLSDTSHSDISSRYFSPYGFSLETPFNTLTTPQKNLFLYGDTDIDQTTSLHRTIKKKRPKLNHPQWLGIIPLLRQRYRHVYSDKHRFYFRSYMSSYPCPTCSGNRLSPASLSIKVQGKSIADMMGFNVDGLIDTFSQFQFSTTEMRIANQVVKEIKSRLEFLQNVGLGYLTLNRKSGSLSGGEFQRIRLATQIGAGLTGVLYVLDEPSIGLHQRDNQRLIETLKKLRDLGNTLIVVEHDEDTLRQSDYIVEIGPLAGRKGGNIEYAGSTQKFLNTAQTCTADFLRGKQTIDVPTQRRQPHSKKSISLTGVRENNLKNIDVTFPLGQFICITGVSGSGKSSLIYDVLHPALMRHFNQPNVRLGKFDTISGLEHIDKIITIDQSPIGKTPRSNPATYSGAFTPIRELFSQTKDAKIRGFKPGRFSFNVKGGRCEACEGDGVKKIEMHFLSDVFVTCDVCKGRRYNAETLMVKFKGNTIADVLQMTINDTCKLFENIPAIISKLNTLKDVGLGYVQLGQNATTLSGGEAQRVKLAKELSKRSTGKTLYLLDEPTTGLHFFDIKQLLLVFNRLVDSGNTLIVIEHNLDVIKCADHIIDIGPHGGEDGGQIIGSGTPESLANDPNSFTGQFLADVLSRQPSSS
jgi:excinuclease ABC subunit A